MQRILIAACFCVAATQSHAQQESVSPWNKVSERLKASQAVAPLGNDLFGDRVSLSNGALSFVATDVAIPGNSALPVALERQYSVFNRYKRQLSEGMFADWDINLPSIGAVFNPNWQVQANASHPATSSRCSVSGRAVMPLDTPFDHSDFWHGVALNIPGQEAGEILQADTPIALSDGLSYRWITGNGEIRLACLPGIKNGAGEGFLAVTPDGTKYWLDWMGQTVEPGLYYSRPDPMGGPAYTYGMPLRKNTLYVTRIEDRFGNWVDFTYSNAWNAPGRLTRIQASDGRSIVLSYSGNYVSSVTDGARNWAYAYAATPSGRTTLTQVTQPDGSRWSIDFRAFTNDGEIKTFYDANYYVPAGEILRTCTLNEIPQNIDKTWVGTITHPSGAVGEFAVDQREHGRSNVPVSCRNVTSNSGSGAGGQNDKNDDVNLWAIKAYSFTLKQKRISGPGLTTAEWNYSYKPGTSVHYYPGTTREWPVCDWQNYTCSLPPCTSDECAGSSQTTVVGPGNDWTRYTHGNSYLYNEGKLLKVEEGTSEQDILRTTTHRYDLTLQPQTYPAAFGQGLSVNSDGFQAQFHRPLLSTKIVQQGTEFVREVNAFDAYARPTQVTRYSGTVPATQLNATSGGQGGEP